MKLIFAVAAVLSLCAVVGCGGGGGDGTTTGDVTKAVLNAQSQTQSDGYYDSYTFVAGATGQVTVSESSTGEDHWPDQEGFDPYLWVGEVDSQGNVTITDDNDEPADADYKGGLLYDEDAQITMDVTAGHTYVVYAGQDDGVDPGSYSVWFKGAAIQNLTKKTMPSPNSMGRAVVVRHCKGK